MVELSPPTTIAVEFANNSIQCIRFGSRQSTDESLCSCLIFTHGAGGTLTSSVMVDFSCGFSSHLPLLYFQGNANLISRVKMFHAVIEHEGNSTSLGGRSMGARAAVMAATATTKQLVLVSYPLHTNKEVRDQILLEQKPTASVIFVSGDRDSMCDLERLNQVRQKMACRSWLVVIRNADHGMTVKPKRATEEVGKKTGEVVAAWLVDAPRDQTEGEIFWNAEDAEACWSGWSMNRIERGVPPVESCEGDEERMVAKSSKKKRQEQPRKDSKEHSAVDVRHDNEEPGSISSRTRKRKRF